MIKQKFEIKGISHEDEGFQDMPNDINKLLESSFSISNLSTETNQNINVNNKAD